MLIRFLSNVEKEIFVTCSSCNLPGHRGVGGGETLWRHKTQLLIDVCAANVDEVNSNDKNSSCDFVIFSDIDITLYHPLRQELPSIMAEYDICFQREWDWDEKQANIGFIVLRRNAATHTFWQTVLRKIEVEGVWDQEVVNQLIRDQDFIDKIGLKVGLLPTSFWAYSQGALPRDSCILHHANCANSIGRKWAQMSTYRSIFAPASSSYLEAFNLISANLAGRAWRCGELDRRSSMADIEFNDNGMLSIKKGRLNALHITCGNNEFILHGSGEKIFCILDEFYIDRHRGLMLCVGRICPTDYMTAPRYNGYFYMYAPLNAKSP